MSLRKPEGYLLCLNVPVARTGTQEYLPQELGLPPGAGMIPVFRPEEEVFSRETMASFEGMPVTNNHPADGVDVENFRRLVMGHAGNIRRGEGDESDLLLADLIIQDQRLIDAIMEEGKREISCGYTYELREESGRYVQRKIRGNHIAVVDAGRAGPRVSIRDRHPPVDHNTHPTTAQPERRNTHMKKSLTRLLARMAKDGDVETVAEIIEEMIAEEGTPSEEAAPVAVAAAEPAPAVAVALAAPAAVPAAEAPAGEEEPAAPAVTPDEDVLAAILQRLDRLISLLTPAGTASAEPAPEEPIPGADDPAEEIAEAVEEALEAAGEAASPDAAEEIAAIVEEILSPAISATVEEPEEEEDPARDCGCARNNDALAAALTAIRPVLEKMPKQQQRKLCGDIAARLRSGRDTGVYAAIASRRRQDAAPADLGKRIMASRNPHYMKH